MKQIVFLFAFSLLFAASLPAQNFYDGLALYNEEQFEEAAEIFSSLDDDRAILFAGKSFIALADYSKANIYLNTAAESIDDSIREEALYSLALSHFGLKNYAPALQHLYRVIESDNRAGLRQDARRFYSDILNYLSEEERFETLKKLDNSAIRYDLVNRSRSYLQPEKFVHLVEELKLMTTSESTLQRIENELAVSSPIQTFVHEFPEAPIGKVYNVGIILPVFDANDPDFTIPRNLYFGMLIAADEFNSRNTDQKVQLYFKNSHENPDSTAKAFSELILTNNIHAAIGPLFSDPAIKMAAIAEEYQVPMLAPLANADELNVGLTYTFQLNPTFETHGIMMARYAVETLGLSDIAIMIEENDPGRPSALAFREEVQRLGASISYFIEENFAAIGYDLSDFTEVFTTDEQLADSLNYRRSEAIYAPFTGQASTTMMNLLMTDLESRRNNLIILGTESWESAPVTEFQQQFFEIFYSQAFDPSPENDGYQFFSEDYENRFGHQPDRFATVGYDAASFLFQSLETAGNPVYTTRALRTLPPFQGISMKIDFNGNSVNQHVFINPLTERAKHSPAEEQTDY